MDTSADPARPKAGMKYICASCKFITELKPKDAIACGGCGECMLLKLRTTNAVQVDCR
eukprot:m.10362 g.10362  ORF g.10362 m.10362 type:complete len:58 (+) comp5551_c0_seq1:288-461(+)